MRVGILGGTFDPPHFAHKEIAYRSLNQFNLDKVLFIPTGFSWQKDSSVAYKKRFAMTKLLIENESKFEISDIENNQDEPTYTANTLEKLGLDKKRSFFILGADAALGIKSWHNYVILANFVQFLIAPRPEIDVKQIAEHFPFDYDTISGEELDISSTHIRNLIENNKELSEHLPENVIQFIKEESVY